MFTWSENPYIDMWENINFLSKEENVKKVISGQIVSKRTILYSESDVLEKKAAEISMCVRQAFEFFTAADNCSITTSPLLYFYGMLSLAKAIVIADNRDVFIDSIKYHGLHTRPTNERLKD